EGLTVLLDKLIGAHLAHGHGLALLPAEAFAIEAERRSLVAGGEFVPLAVPRLGWRERGAGLVGKATHHIEDGALWVGEEREAADIWNVRRRDMLGAAR